MPLSDNLNKSQNLKILYNSWKNKTRPNTKWKMAGDMPGRMDWLVEQFSNLDSITEFGHYQGCSTTIWMACLPKKIVTVDINKFLNQKEHETIAKELGIDFKCIIDDDLAITIEETDLLFIDTMHTEDHTYKELKKHSNQVRKYLAFHDVNPKRFQTHLGIEKWLKEKNNDWKELYHDPNDCGFLILERNK